MNTFWQEFLKYLGSVTIAAAALAWLIKSIVNHVLSKDIETFKKRLELQSETEIEKLKSQLQIAAKEHEVRFSKLHEKRATIVAEFYESLVSLRRSIEFFVRVEVRRTGLQGHKDRARDLFKRASELTAFFSKNELYFRKDIAERIERLIEIIQEPVYKYHIFANDPDKLEKYMPEVIESWQEEVPEIDNILQLLAGEFRTLLGSEDNNAPDNGMHPTPPQRASHAR